MAEIVLPTEVEVAQASSMVSPISRRRRLFALGVVLSVSLLHFVFASFYYLLGGTVPLDANQHAFRLIGALVAESTSLLVLWYVLSDRGSGWRTIGWTPAWKDLPEGFGLFIVGFGSGGWSRLVAGGVVIGVGVAAMHYLGMAAMSMTMSISYSLPLVALSVLIAIVAGTAALWIGTWVRTIKATLGAAVVMGVAVTGMHYTGMAALHVTGMATSSTGSIAGLTGTASVSGATAGTFLIPLLLVISLATFLLTLSISMTPSEDEIRADQEMRRRLEYLEQRNQ